MHRAFGIAVLAAMFFTPAVGAEAPAQTMSVSLAREVASKTVALVESRGLYPRQQDEYDRARMALLAILDGPPLEVDRTELYRRITGLLATLDTNGHSFLITARHELTVQRTQTASSDLPPATFQVLQTSKGKVLRWTPPPSINNSMTAIGPYLTRFHDEAETTPDITDTCALVVDLSEQTGGNAWPPLVAMHPLFSDANNAMWVDRDGKRTALMNRAGLQEMRQRTGEGRANPLSRFDKGPLAVVTDKHTSSAGEMLLIALLGEARVQTFGSTSSGMTTANATYPLPDGSTLVLTQSRYAIGDRPVIRGGIEPMRQNNPGESSVNPVASAAEWVAANSVSCSHTEHK
jgi:hypothetical protein